MKNKTRRDRSRRHRLRTEKKRRETARALETAAANANRRAQTLADELAIYAPNESGAQCRLAITRDQVRPGKLWLVNFSFDENAVWQLVRLAPHAYRLEDLANYILEEMRPKLLEACEAILTPENYYYRGPEAAEANAIARDSRRPRS